jgi:hypothetical protein
VQEAGEAAEVGRVVAGWGVGGWEAVVVVGLEGVGWVEVGWEAEGRVEVGWEAEGWEGG